MARVSRRSFVRTIGAGLLAAPFVRLAMGGGSARGAGVDDGPSRLVVFFSPNGTIPHKWRPIEAAGAGPGYDFAPGTILEPLRDRRGALTVIDGLYFHGADNHEGGQAAMLTNRGGIDSPTGGRSIDQVVAHAIGADSRFRSLELGVQTSAWGGGVQTRMCYAGPGDFVTPDDDPRHVFERLFGAAGADAETVRRRRQSVLDLTRDEIGDLHARLGRAEQKKLEAHLEALRAVEKQLAPTSSCDAPAPPPAGGVYDNANFPAITASQTELLALALACGQTRVATLQCAHTIAPTVMTWADVDDGHHSLSHMDDGNTQGVADFVAAERWFAARFGDLLDALAAHPDPDAPEDTARTLLDSTLVVWAKEMGDSRLHVCKDVPFVLAGGGAAMKHGRWVRTGGEPHARLLVWIAQRFGLALDTFGDPGAGNGALGGLS